MDIILAGPGRAGGAVCIAAKRAGHRIVAVAGRTPGTVQRVARLLDAVPLGLSDELPPADLLMIAVRDDAIAEVAAHIHAPHVDAAIHLSGLTPLDALAPLRQVGVAIGVLHPLQTLPTPDAGADALAGSWMAVTTPDERLRTVLEDLAASLGARSFTIPDAARAVYHAAAAAAANGTVAALAVAEELFTAAGVPFDAARPLVDAVVANAFGLGPGAALTGPIARGDVGTVRAQLAAVGGWAPEELDRFIALGRLVADIAGKAELFEEVWWTS